MPRRGDKSRKAGRRTRSLANNTQAIGPPTPTSNATSSSRRANCTPSSSGRNTNNSRGNRGRKPIRKVQNSKKPNGRRGGKSKKEGSHLQDPNCYKADNGEVYRPGDFAYVDSQQAELPYHICVIRDFKLARKDSVIAEVKWYYRVSELPEAVYLMLMEDRMKSNEAEVFSNPKVKHRELFMAFNVDTHPASLFKGKCKVKQFEEVGVLSEYMEGDDAFFYCHGYKPESRRLTNRNEESFVPYSQQAKLPECIGSYGEVGTQVGDRYSNPEERVENWEELVWKPHLPDNDLLMFLRAARSIALHAGICMSGYIADGYLAASSDETTQNAFDVLHQNNHSTEKALQDLVKRPIVSRLVGKKNWTKECSVLFAKGMRQFGKNFFKIKKELLPNKEIKELAEYYYYWKKTNPGLSSRNTRRQRKQTHLRMGRAIMKPREPTPDREFVDWNSCDEEDGDESEKPHKYYACRYCYTTDSPNWHHAGVERGILCQTCRLHYQQYGYMVPITERGDPPEFLFKDFHEALAVEVQNNSQQTQQQVSPQQQNGRKTRNSNGSRGARAGLRSGKNYNKSDTDEEEEAEASDSSESSSEEEVPVNKPKVLQTRRSILDNFSEVSKQAEEPPAKRPKRDEDNEVNESEEDSIGSTNGEGDHENGQKSPGGTKSPSHSSSSSQADYEGESPCSSRDSADPSASNAPQQFIRVSKDHESTCARTDLAFVHPPAEKKIATKQVIPVPFPGPSSSSHHEEHISATIAATPITITPHAPQLPQGPGPFLGFPMPYGPMTPLSGTPVNMGHENPIFRRANSMDAAMREQEQMWHQQQQWLALAAQHQQKQLEMQSQFPPGAAVHPGPHPPGVGPHPVEQLAFNFPTPEEMLLRQRMAAQMGLPEFAMLPPGMLPPGMHPGFPMENQLAAVKLESEHAAVVGGIPTPHLMHTMQHVPGMDMLVQHQQQLAAVAMAGMNPLMNPSLPENMIELQRLVEAISQQAQKDPHVLQTPYAQCILQHHQRLLQGVAAHEQMVHQMQMSHRMQELMLQQQHELQQQMGLGRPSPHEDSTTRRPGVIVQNVQPK